MHTEWDESGTFLAKGGMKEMGDSLARGHVIVLSLWYDTATAMNWLDASTGEGPGSLRGPCDGSQIDLNSAEATNAQVTFADIR